MRRRRKRRRGRRRRGAYSKVRREDERGIERGRVLYIPPICH